VSRPRWQHKVDFRTLGEYLLEGEKQEDGAREFPDGENRVATSFCVNTGVADDFAELSPDQVRDVSDWMGSTAALNKRIRKSAAVHYVMSLPSQDAKKSTPEFWRNVAPRVLDALDMAEHEAMFVVHKDTDNPHMHVMINRVHPTKETAVDPFRDLIALEELNRKLEKEFNLKSEPGRHIDPQTVKTYDWEAVRRGEIEVPQRRKRMTRVQMEQFARQAKKDLADKPFSEAESWFALEQRLGKQGYSLRAEGRGMKLCRDGVEVKLTKVAGKGLGREKLEAKFGAWNDYQGDKAQAKAEGVSVEMVAARRAQAAATEKVKSQDAQKAERKKLREWMEPMLTHGARVLETSEDAREPVPDYLGPSMDRGNFRKGLEGLTPEELLRLHQVTLAARERVEEDQRAMAKEEGGRSCPAYNGAENARINIVGALDAINREAKVRQIDLQAVPERQTGQSEEQPSPDSPQRSEGTWKAVLAQSPEISVQAVAESFVQMEDEDVLGHLSATRKAIAELEARKRHREYTPQMAMQNMRMKSKRPVSPVLFHGIN